MAITSIIIMYLFSVLSCSSFFSVARLVKLLGLSVFKQVSSMRTSHSSLHSLNLSC